MKKDILILFLLILTITLKSQINISKNFSYTISKPYKVIDAREKIYLSKGDELLIVKINDDRLDFQKFNTQTLELLETRQYNDMGDEFDVELLSEIDGRYLLFYSTWDDKNRKELLFVREINFDDCLFKDNGNLLLSVEGKVSGRPLGGIFAPDFFITFGVRNKFNIQFSYDKSKILVKYRMRPEIKNDAKNYDIIGLHVFNTDLIKVWGKEVKMPYTEKQMDAYDFTINNKGDVFINATVLNDATKDITKDKENTEYHVELLKYKAFTAEFTKTTISLSDKFINDMWIFGSNDNNMICTGFYNTGRKWNNADGILIIRVDENGNILNSEIYEIPASIINQYEGRIAGKKTDEGAEMKNIFIRNMLVQDDESTTLIGEQHYVVTHTTYNPNGGSSSYKTYHYNDILVSKINKDGSLAWMKKLPKSQTGTNGLGGMSFKYFFSDGFHYFMFLDNVKNNNLLINQRPNVHHDGAGGYLTAYKVNDNGGTIEKLSILNLRDAKGIELHQFKPSRIIDITPKDFILEVYKKNKEDVLVKIHLND